MRYTILGFSQPRLLELKLGLDEAMILRWYIDFQSTGKMRPVVEDDKTWFWVNFSGVLEDIPIVGGSTKTISRRFEKLVTAGVMEHTTIRVGGVFSCYRIVESVYRSLIDNAVTEQPEKEINVGLDKSVQRKTELSDRWTNLSEQKISILDNNKTPLDTKVSIPPKGENPPKTKRFVKPTLEEVRAYCTERRNTVIPEKWMDHYESNGWKVGRTAMKDWKASVRTWEHGRFDKKPEGSFRSGRANDAWVGKKSGKISL